MRFWGNYLSCAGIAGEKPPGVRPWNPYNGESGGTRRKPVNRGLLGRGKHGEKILVTRPPRVRKTERRWIAVAKHRAASSLTMAPAG